MTDPVSIRRRQRLTNRLLIGIIVLLVGAGAYQFLVVNPDQAQVRSAVCSFRDDLEQRVASGEEFVKNHPHGAFGISGAQLRLQIANQERTVQSLQDLSCG